MGGIKTGFTTGAAVVGVADVSAHTFTVSIDGQVVREMPASMGKPGFETPPGTFSVLKSNGRWSSTPGRLVFHSTIPRAI